MTARYCERWHCSEIDVYVSMAYLKEMSDTGGVDELILHSAHRPSQEVGLTADEIAFCLLHMLN